MKWPDHDEPPACARLHAWLNTQDAQARSVVGSTKEDIDAVLAAAAVRMRLARRPLIWLESADVPTTRAAVQLAEATGATLHVAQSPGAELIAAVTASDGWVGTTLAEVRSTASLVIHVGQQHLRSAPMWELRFANPAAQHVFLDRCPDSWLSDPGLNASIEQMSWTKDQWLDRLTRTLLVMSDESSALEHEALQADRDAGWLAELLLGSHYTVVVWSEDELSDELDLLIVRRLLELARHVSRTSRCSLLALPQDPGRVTAKDTVLWLTNHTGPLRFVGNRWTKEWMPHESLQQWQQAFDWILLIRNLPSDRPLPELDCGLVIDSYCNVQSSYSHVGGTEGNQRLSLAVAAVGVDVAGHLVRADHGLAAFVDRADNAARAFPIAAEVIDQFAQLYRHPDESSRSQVVRP